MQPHPEIAKHQRDAHEQQSLAVGRRSTCPRAHCRLDSAGEAMLKNAMEGLGLSARAHDRILRVACTIADLSGCETIQSEHLQEAVNYRTLDRSFWS